MKGLRVRKVIAQACQPASFLCNLNLFSLSFLIFKTKSTKTKSEEYNLSSTALTL